MNKFLTTLFVLCFCMSIAPQRLLADNPVVINTVEESQSSQPKIGVVYITDPIDFKKVTANLLHAAKSEEIQGILIIVNSYGGAMDVFSVLHDLVKRISTIKPIVCLIDGSALSGGYMVASAADYVIAHSCSEVGNIGVVHTIQKYKHPKITGPVEAKLDVEVFQAGDCKTIYHNYSKNLSEVDKKYVQDRLNKVYEQFIRMIVQNRGLCLENYKEIADGKWFIPSEAIENGLIDEIGTIFEAEHKLKELISKRNPALTSDTELELYFYEDRKESVRETESI